jgi:hypothetical protein
MSSPLPSVRRCLAGVLGVAVLGSVGCFGTGKKNEILQIQPETKSLLNTNAQGKPQLPAPTNVAKSGTFDPKQTGGSNINLKDTFARTTPIQKNTEPRPALPAPQTTDSSVSLANYSTPAPTGTVMAMPEQPKPTGTLPTPKLDMPLEPPMTRNTALPTGQPGRDTGTGQPIPSPTMPPLPMGDVELPKPMPMSRDTDARPRPPLPHSDIPLPMGDMPKLPSATDGPIPGTKALPLAPAEPIRPN